jgi:mRNA interferase MazF
MMTKPTEAYEQFDVVAVPFPFTDAKQAKRRPALVLSSGTTFNGKIIHSVLAMITSARNSPWPLDVEIGDLAPAGLAVESVVRMKLFTLDHRLIARTLGHLSDADRRRVAESLHALFEL